MTTRLVSVVIDAADPGSLARFWADLLGWRVTYEDHEEVTVEASEADGWGLELVFVPVTEVKTGKNRVHLDLSSTSLVAQQATAARAGDLGATPVDIGQGDVPWVVLADPEGNEFCVLEPRPEYADTGTVASIVVDVGDPRALAPFWSSVTGWPIIRDTESITSLRANEGHGPWLELVKSAEPKTVKNRVHLDIAPFADGDVAAEEQRLGALGAVPVDIGQREVPWTVLADPDGNEFCVLSPR
ncbi:MAG: VOC family protein [Actinomycetota bacterium]|nr:VOC family protein [Actinomycetota bacterium]